MWLEVGNTVGGAAKNGQDEGLLLRDKQRLGTDSKAVQYSLSRCFCVIIAVDCAWFLSASSLPRQASGSLPFRG